MTDHSLTRFLSLDGDIDPVETAEWRDAFLALVAAHGPQRARFVLDQLAEMARSPHTVNIWLDRIFFRRSPIIRSGVACT